MTEPYLDKKGLAHVYSCSVRWIELRMADGMPAWRSRDGAKFLRSETDPWLIEHGFIRNRG